MDALAEQREAQAEDEFQQRRQTDEQNREEIQKQADQREAALEGERSAKKRRAADEDARKRKEAAQVEIIEEKVVARESRAARATRVSTQRGALQQERKAVAAKERVTDLDAKLENTKAARKSS